MTQKRVRGQTRRLPVPLLPAFLGSTLPEQTKVTVEAAVHDLNALWAADPQASIPPSTLLGVVTALNCRTAQAIDLLRILLGLSPHDSAHSRQNQSALLRGKATQQGRTPQGTDFAADHPLHVFAPAYWGGIERWGQGRTARQQLPKSHWSGRANQLAALRDTAARFPGQPVTHALLGRAGYHALARQLDATALAALAANCGLDRALRKGAAADWTAERVVSAYVALCRTHGVTLSSDALRQLGGAASSLRNYGVRIFGSHAGLVRAAMAADPAIRPQHRAITPDGTVLGSWAEVQVHAALRSGLSPDTAIRLHMPLAPELPLHSCDFVVTRGDRSAWIEVLMVSHDAMGEPDANATVRRYAARWQTKSAWYADRPIMLVTVEPADVFDEARLDAIVAEIRRHLEPPADGCSVTPTPQPPCPTEGRARPRHTWTMDELRKAVTRVAGTGGHWPTDAAMIAAGFGGALAAIKRRHLHGRLAAACGLRRVHVRGAWTEARVVEALVTWVGAHGAYPTTAALKAAGEGRLESARVRLFVGRGAELRATVEGRCGLAPGGRLPAGSTATPEALAALLRPLCDELGHFPNAAEMTASGLSATVYDAVSRRMGVAAMAAWMAVPYVGPERLTRDGAAALLLTAAAPSLLPGVPPRITTTMIRARLGSRGIGILRRQIGSIAALRRLAAARLPAADREG